MAFLFLPSIIVLSRSSMWKGTTSYILTFILKSDGLVVRARSTFPDRRLINDQRKSSGIDAAFVHENMPLNITLSISSSPLTSRRGVTRNSPSFGPSFCNGHGILPKVNPLQLRQCFCTFRYLRHHSTSMILALLSHTRPRHFLGH